MNRDLHTSSTVEMSQTAKDLLIIYETEANKWASYLQSMFTGPISAAGICCFDITKESGEGDKFLGLAQYTCKLLILSRGMLEGLCQRRRFFLAQVLTPAAHVVVLLCGVDSLMPLLELVPLNGDECLQISTEQDASDYVSAVTGIVKKGVSASNVKPSMQKSSGSEEKVEQMQPTGADGVTSSIVVIPPRVLCGSSTELFILLKNEAAGYNIQVEFAGVNQKLIVKPVRWNERILFLRAPDFPSGSVTVNVYSGGVLLNNTQLQYYTSMEEITSLLSRVTDPVDFMCQALHVSSVDKLDEKLSSMLLGGLPAGGFLGLQCENPPDRELHHADVPSLLHFTALYGCRSLSSLLLQCPGARRALRTANCHGQTPTDLAKSHGHKELHVLLKETLRKFTSGEDNADASVYEMMYNTDTQNMQEREGEEEEEEEEDEDLYAPLRVNDENDTVLNSVMIVNRPPAPTPRPECTQTKQDRTPYIAQVFKKKTSPQGDADLYSLPTKQAQGRERSVASTYDTFVPKQMRTSQLLAELQQRVKAGTLPVDDRQEVQRGVEAKQQEKLSHLQASGVNNRADDNGVYDKISVVHHAPSFTGNESQGGSPPAEPHFYSKPLKGQQSNVFGKP